MTPPKTDALTGITTIGQLKVACENIPDDTHLIMYDNVGSVCELGMIPSLRMPGYVIVVPCARVNGRTEHGNRAGRSLRVGPVKQGNGF